VRTDYLLNMGSWLPVHGVVIAEVTFTHHTQQKEVTEKPHS